MSTKRLDLGAVSAYAMAVEQGYRGTEEEFGLILANAANYAAESKDAKTAAETAAGESEGSAHAAEGYKNAAGKILEDVHTEGMTQIQAISTAGEEQIQSMEAKGTEQIQAIETVGTEQIQSMEAKGTEQIQAIETVGTEQTEAAKAEIDAKGKQTLDSIPENYTELQTEVDELKVDLSNKITKFYASNQGEIYITDSDNGKIQDMMIYGKSSQDGAPTPDNPSEIKSVVNPTVKVYGSNLYSGSDLIGLTEAYTTDFIHVILHKGKICISFDAFSDTSNGEYLITVEYFDANKEKIGGNGSANEIGNNISHVSFEFDGTKAGNNYEDLNLQNISYVKIMFNIYNATATEITYKNIMISATDSDFEPYKPIQTVTIPHTLNAIPVKSGGNVTIDGQQYFADYVDVERGKLVRIVNSSKLDNTQSIVDKTEWLLAEPQEIDFTTEEITAFKALVTYYPTTNISVNSEQLDGYTVFNYPISMANGWNYVKKQLNDNRDYIYDMDIQSAEAYVNSEYAVALTELEV